MDYKTLAIAIHAHGFESVEMARDQDFLVLTHSFPWQTTKHQAELNTWQNIQNWVAQIQREDDFVSIVIPTQEVTFRILEFPFQDKKKIKQILPFELENELLGKTDEYHYIYKIHPLADGRASVSVFMLLKNYLEDIKRTFAPTQLLIKNIDFSAHALFQSRANVPAATQESAEPSANNLALQIYLGADEAFLNFIQNDQLTQVKIFPNRVSEILATAPHFKSWQVNTFLNLLKSPPPEPLEGTPESGENPQINEAETIQSVAKELKRVVSQINLFVRTLRLPTDTLMEFHGLFGSGIVWDGVILKWNPELIQTEHLNRTIVSLPKNDVAQLVVKALPQEQVQVEVRDTETLQPNSIALKKTLRPSAEDSDFSAALPKLSDLIEPENGPLETQSDTVIENLKPQTENLNTPKATAVSLSEKAALSQSTPTNKELNVPTLIETQPLWGILGTLSQIGLMHLEGHQLSFFSEATPWNRFYRKYYSLFLKASIIFGVTLVLLMLNFAFNLSLMNKEIESHEIQMAQKLKQLLQQDIGQNIPQGMTQLEEKVGQRRDETKVAKQFEERTYQQMQMLKKVSELKKGDEGIKFEKMEFNKERFVLTGRLPNYETLQNLKKGVAEIDIFRDREVAEQNQKVQDEILFRITVNR